MKTSSDHRSPSEFRPTDAHWQELTARLPMTVGKFGEWMDDQLQLLEKSHQDFVTRRSLRKSLRQGR